MKIYSVSDPAFKPYGKVLTGFDTAALIAAMKTVPMPVSYTHLGSLSYDGSYLSNANQMVSTALTLSLIHI